MDSKKQNKVPGHLGRKILQALREQGALEQSTTPHSGQPEVQQNVDLAASVQESHGLETKGHMDFGSQEMYYEQEPSPLEATGLHAETDLSTSNFQSGSTPQYGSFSADFEDDFSQIEQEGQAFMGQNSSNQPSYDEQMYNEGLQAETPYEDPMMYQETPQETDPTLGLDAYDQQSYDEVSYDQSTYEQTQGYEEQSYEPPTFDEQYYEEPQPLDPPPANEFNYDQQSYDSFELSEEEIPEYQAPQLGIPATDEGLYTTEESANNDDYYSQEYEEYQQQPQMEEVGPPDTEEYTQNFEEPQPDYYEDHSLQQAQSLAHQIPDDEFITQPNNYEDHQFESEGYEEPEQQEESYNHDRLSYDQQMYGSTEEETQEESASQQNIQIGYSQEDLTEVYEEEPAYKTSQWEEAKQESEKPAPIDLDAVQPRQTYYEEPAQPEPITPLDLDQVAPVPTTSYKPEPLPEVKQKPAPPIKPAPMVEDLPPPTQPLYPEPPVRDSYRDSARLSSPYQDPLYRPQERPYSDPARDYYKQEPLYTDNNRYRYEERHYREPMNDQYRYEEHPAYQDPFNRYEERSYREPAYPAIGPEPPRVSEIEARQASPGSNIDTLSRLVAGLPPGVTRQTGAQIIRQTMEAMGISMNEVLAEAQNARGQLNQKINQNIDKIEDYKRQIRQLDDDIHAYQRRAKELDDLISLFIIPNQDFRGH